MRRCPGAVRGRGACACTKPVSGTTHDVRKGSGVEYVSRRNRRPGVLFRAGCRQAHVGGRNHHQEFSKESPWSLVHVVSVEQAPAGKRPTTTSRADGYGDCVPIQTPTLPYKKFAGWATNACHPGPSPRDSRTETGGSLVRAYSRLRRGISEAGTPTRSPMHLVLRDLPFRPRNAGRVGETRCSRVSRTGWPPSPDFCRRRNRLPFSCEQGRFSTKSQAPEWACLTRRAFMV